MQSLAAEPPFYHIEVLDFIIRRHRPSNHRLIPCRSKQMLHIVVERRSLELGKIHQGDCVELMRQIEGGTIDLVFADPPFNIGYEYDEYHDRQADEEYLDWSRQWMDEVHRVLKPGGTFWLAIGDEYAAELKVDAEHKIGFATRSWVVWYYTFGVNCTKKFSRSHAHLFHFVKDESNFTFNAEDPQVRVPSARALVYADKRANPGGPLAGRYLDPAAAGFARRLSADRRHVVLRPRGGHVQRAPRLSRLPDARATAGPHHPRQQQPGRNRARPVRRQRHDARRGQEAGPQVDRLRTFGRSMSAPQPSGLIAFKKAPPSTARPTRSPARRRPRTAEGWNVPTLDRP